MISQYKLCNDPAASLPVPLTPPVICQQDNGAKPEGSVNKKRGRPPGMTNTVEQNATEVRVTRQSTTNARKAYTKGKIAGFCGAMPG